MSARFQQEGKVEVEKQRRNSLPRQGASLEAQVLRTAGRIPLGPYAFLVLSSERAEMTSLEEITMLDINELDEVEGGGAVALDISKAFDRVWHKALISKLPSFGINPSLCDLLSDFLSGRSIAAVVDGHRSSYKSINSGVPQGSFLSPTLFLIFINDLLSITSSPIHSYADDSTLHYPFQFVRRPSQQQLIDSRRMALEQLTSDLSRISNWGRENMVVFNASKTQLIHLST